MANVDALPTGGAIADAGAPGVYTVPGIPGILTHLEQGGGEPVKTFVLRELKAIVETVVEVGSVVARPGKGIELETAKYPIVFMFDDPESKRDNNRVTMISMPLQLDIYLKDQEMSFSDQADWVQALIEQKFAAGSAGFKTYGLVITPDADTTGMKDYIDEFLGKLTLRFTVQYAHLRGNPFETGK